MSSHTAESTEVDRKGLFTELTEFLADVALSSPTYQRAFGKNKVKKDVLEGRELNGDEKSHLIKAVQAHPWLFMVASGQQDLIQLPHSAQVKQAEIRKLEDALRSARDSFRTEFPDLQGSTALNSSAKDCMAMVMEGIAGRKVGASAIDLAQVFAKPKEDESSSNGAASTEVQE